MILTQSEAEAQRADREAQRVEVVKQQVKTEAQRAEAATMPDYENY